MPAPKGNKFGSHPNNDHGRALKTEELRQEAYESYCEHIASGMPKYAWFFKKGKFGVCWETMDKYLEEFKAEFDANLLRDAKSKRYAKWFKKGENMADGMIKGNYSPQVWQVIMKNMFKEQGWDTLEQSRSNETDARKALRYLESEREGGSAPKEAESADG